MTEPARILQLLDAALAQEPAARPAFVLAACGSDSELRAEVEALLAAEALSENFLKPLTGAPRDRSGERVGPWRLKRKLGEGGMGAVYLAERDDNLYTKQIALKLLRFDIEDLRVRFVNERRILATLDHPNIARLLDAGTDDAGAPYVAMEYVEGAPITDWCERHKLDVRARVALFLKVLDAVQSAHGHLIVHRDLKPANILVDARAEPKLLDFGIAKLIDTQTRGLTLTGAAPLTPDYASPEQVRGEPLGVASDIYALGILLFELVTGERPYAITSLTPLEIRRKVCDTQSPRPSHVAHARGIRIDRDLDHVILRALAKAANERYASCSEFADDLRRFLTGQAVRATHAGWRYRSGKFINRHRTAVVLTALIAAAVVASSVIAIYQARIAHDQMRIANTEREKAERVNQFLKDMLVAPDPDKSGRNVTVAELLDKAAAALDAKPNDDVQTVAAMRVALGETYDHLGLLDPALKQMRAAVAQLDAEPRTSLRERAYATKDLGEMLVGHDDSEAKIWLLQVGAIAAPDSEDVMASAENSLGQIAHRLGDQAAATNHYQRAIDFYQQSHINPDYDGFASALISLAILQSEQGNSQDSLTLAQQALDLVHGIRPRNDALASRVLTRVAYIRKKANDLAGANAAYEEALKLEMELYGENHQETIMTLANLAGLRTSEHRYTEAENLARRAYDAAHAHLPEPHIQTANAATALGVALYGEDHTAEAVPPLREALATFHKLLPADNPLVANAESSLGIALAQSGQQQEGETLLRDGLVRLTAKFGEDRVETRPAAARLRAFESGQKYEPSQ